MSAHKEFSSPSAIAYARAVLARAEALGFTASTLTMSVTVGSGGASSIIRMRCAVAKAVDSAGIGVQVFRLIAETRANAGRFRDVLYRQDLRTADVEALAAILTNGLSYTPPRRLPKPEQAAAPVRPAAPARFHHLGPNAFEDSAAARRAGTIGQAPRPETWAPPAQEW